MKQVVLDNLKLEDAKRRIFLRCCVEDMATKLRKFRPKYYVLFNLYFIYGHSTAEIADFLGITRDSVARRIKRLIKKFQK